ncbi:hypothetical protein, partial [Enterobacter hormaechei]|uniref:hypothetical protein n=1 Tax=Enterobacter hormaechei TaxID=158836 RepID=UPI001BCDC459
PVGRALLGFPSPSFFFSPNASSILRFMGFLHMVLRLLNTFSGNYAFSGEPSTYTTRLQILMLVKMIT